MKKTSKKSRVKKSTTTALGSPRFYTLEVYILSGMITEAFAKKNRMIGRSIRIWTRIMSEMDSRLAVAPKGHSHP